jgi:hypothetical protein
MSAILSLIWAALLPYIGPILHALWSWFGPMGSIARVVRIAGILVGVAGAALGAWWLSRGPDPRDQLVSVYQVNAQAWRAKATVLEAAGRAKDETLAKRAADIERLARELDRLNAEMEAIRAQSQDPDTVLWAADSDWLRAKRARSQDGRAGGRRGGAAPLPAS